MKSTSPAGLAAGLAALALLTGFAPGIHAQTLKPGLWEIVNTIRGAGQDAARAQQDMANLAPEQRKMMQDMMAKHGVTMGSIGAGNVSVRVCMTKEMVERNDLPSQQGDCRHTSSPRIGNSMKVSFSCKNPPSTGEGTITFLTPESYTMRMAVSTSAGGRPEKIDMDATGKWLAADCGSVKPMAPPKR